MGMRRIVARGMLVLLLSGAVGVAGCGGRKDGGEAKPPAPTYTADQAAAVRAQADGGDAGAQLKVGRMHATGDGAPQDTTETVLWYRKAADQGLADAQFALGEAYENGVGVEGSGKQAAVWYLKAARQGQVSAMKRLAYLRQQDSDPAAARDWYEKAAEAGDAEAQSELGSLYLFGWEAGLTNFAEIKSEVPKNASRAAFWFERAVEQGLCDKAYYLASLNHYGGMSDSPKDGRMKTDPLVAYKWAQVALKGLKPYPGGKEAFEDRSRKETMVSNLQNVLTSAQEAEGERQADAFLARVKCKD